MWKWILGGLLLLLLAFVIRVVLAVRNATKLGNEQLARALRNLKPDDLPRLVEQCQEFFRSALDTNLDLGDWQQATSALDAALKDREQRRKILRGLAQDDVAYFWVLPVGAFLGRLLERHAQGQWMFDGEGPPTMVFSAGGGEMVAWPFDKVQKHLWEGDAGDLVAYVNTHVHLDQLMAQIDQLQENTAPDRRSDDQ